METICHLKLETASDSRWIHLKEVAYKQNNTRKRQEIVCSHNSCGILIHNTTRDVFVFVKQFRPAVFMHEVGWDSLQPNSSECLNFSDEKLERGFTLELCAGILDKEGKSIEEIASEEVLEECGYRVNPKDLETVLATRNNSLHSGTLQNLFYAGVTDDMKAEGWGGGNIEEGEVIEIVELKVTDVLASIFEDSLPKPLGLTFALLWFLFTKASSSSSMPSLTNGCHGNRDDGGAVKMTDATGAANDDSYAKRSKTSDDDDDEGSTKCDESRLNVADVTVSDIKRSTELQIYRLHYKHNNYQKAWDFFYVESNCSTLVHNVSRNVFVLIRKFSPAVYGSLQQQQPSKGRSCGSAAGPVDPSFACLTQLCSVFYEISDEPCIAASENVFKTFGYKVPPSEFKKILKSRSNVGIAGALLTLLYVRVTDEMKMKEETNSPKNPSSPDEQQNGPSDNDNDYDIVEVPVSCSDDSELDGLRLLMQQGKNPMSLSLALLWYYYQEHRTSESL